MVENPSNPSFRKLEARSFKNKQNGLCFFPYEKCFYALFFLCLGISVLSAFRGHSSFEQFLSLHDRENVMISAVKHLKDSNKNLEATIQKIKRSQGFAKMVLKDKYHMTEEGERLVYFND